MFSIEFISLMKTHIASYQNYPYPVVICDLNFKVFWGNPLAKKSFPLLFIQEDMKAFLSELDMEAVKGEIKKSGSYVAGGLIPLDDAVLTLSGAFYETEMIGYIGLFVRGEQYPELDYISQTIPVFNNQIRHALHEMFSIADSLALKADLLYIPWVSEHLNTVGLSAYEILRLTNNITAFSRLQYFQDVFVKANVPLVRWMWTIKSGVKELAMENGVTVVFNLPEDEIHLPLDLEWFQIAFFNILHNSLYYTRENNNVIISAEKYLDNIRIVVADKGIGMSQEALEKAVNPYYSYAPLEKMPSVGLGLTIAERVLINHKGSLRIESELGVGTTVTMCFPLGGFSKTMSFAQNDTYNNVADRFSPLYIGLTSAVRTPYKEAENNED